MEEIICLLDEIKENQTSNYSERISNCRLAIKKSELKISNMIDSFPEIDGTEIKKYIQLFFKEYNKISQTKKVDFEILKTIITNFSKASRKIHAELLKI